MNSKELLKVGISIGDPNGIGPEVVLKSLENPEILDLFTPVIFISKKLYTFYSKELSITTKFQSVKTVQEISPGRINVITDGQDDFMVSYGNIQPEAGAVAWQSLKSATAALSDGAIDVLVTAPIHKESIQSEDFKFPGHTNYLAQELGGESLMFLVSDSLRVGLLTDHVPVKKIVDHITPEAIKLKIGLIKDSLKKDFAITKPRIAVLGINPHVGDNGVIGDDDQKTMIPVLEELRQDGTLIFGPYAADTFFGSKKYVQFDAVLASYHDQGLVGFKTISFGDGVNFTAGLSKVRTSPDHGTGFDIAGKGLADPTSFTCAIHTAIQIFKTRNDHEIYSKNPLKISIKKRGGY